MHSALAAKLSMLNFATGMECVHTIVKKKKEQEFQQMAFAKIRKVENMFSASGVKVPASA